MSFFQRTEDLEPGGSEGLVGELVRSIQRSFTGVVADHLEDLLANPDRRMCLVDRHISLAESGHVYTVDLLLFHVTLMRYVAIQVHAGRFDPARLVQARFALKLIDDLVRVPAVHAPTIGVLLCTDAAPDQQPGPVVVTLYDDITPAQQAELPTPAELTSVIERCLATNDVRNQKA